MCNSSTEGASTINGGLNTLRDSSEGTPISVGCDRTVLKHQAAQAMPGRKCANKQGESHQLFFEKVLSVSIDPQKVHSSWLFTYFKLHYFLVPDNFPLLWVKVLLSECMHTKKENQAIPRSSRNVYAAALDL